MINPKSFFPITTLSVFILGLSCVTPTDVGAVEHHPPQQIPADNTSEISTSKTLMPVQQGTATILATGAISDRLAALNAEFPTGMETGVSSGDATPTIGIWGNPYYSYSNDDNVSTGYDSYTYGTFLGGDYILNDQLTVGLMLGIDTTDIDSKVNNGGSDTLGITVAPYGRFTLNQNYSFDVSAGYTNSNSDSDRVAAGTRVTGSSDVNRFFTSVGLNGSFWKDRWNFLGRLGTTNSFDNRNEYTESNGTIIGGDSSSFGQFQAGLTTGYYFAKVRPWVSVMYAYDYDRELPQVGAGQVSPSDDRDQVVLGYGASIFNLGRFTADLSVKHTLFKENYENTSVGLSLSTSF